MGLIAVSPVYNARMDDGRPQWGKPIRMIYEDQSWAKGEPTEDFVRALVRGTNCPVCFDIEEHAGFYSPTLSDDQARLNTIVQWAQKETRQMVGLFTTAPMLDIDRSVTPQTSKFYKAMQSENDKHAAAFANVDVMYPCLYTYIDDVHHWVRYSRALISEAKRLSNGKPVLPFLWPEFMESVRSTTGQWLSSFLWQSQLELCLNESDGCVIWGGYKQVWDDSPWFKILSQYL